MEAYDFEERLERAATPPASWYTDPRVLAAERERVFGRTWQLVGRVEQVERPGQFFTTEVAGEPVLIVRDTQGLLRALSNVCRHRAGPIAEGCGERKVFRCGYHGWTYGLDGQLKGAPEFEGVEDWSRDETRLPEFRIETWAGLVFVNLDTACEPLTATLEDLTSLVGERDWTAMKLAARKDWYVECNWKTYVDNYLEGYHIPVVHPSLNRELDYNQYRTETRSFYSIQHAPPRPSATRTRPVDASAPAAQYFWVFPNLMLNVYSDNFSTNLILPLGPERTLTVFEWYFQDASQPDVREKIKETVEFSDEIQIEDIRICEAVQRGLRSRTYDRGRYSVKRENGVHHFHGLLAAFLGRD